ncbi:MAG: radical SAM protein [Magnetococcales bacterium]|nr:radical SAM protein [Magnetococcales bacterium]
MNTLLVNPSYAATANSRYFPLGMASIAACLKEDGHRVICLNLNNIDAKERMPALRRILETEEIALVASGGLSVTMNAIQEIFSLVEAYNTDIIRVLGGGLLTAEPEAVFNHLRPHIGVIGEGEATMRELVAALEAAQPDLAAISGIIYWQGETTHLTPQREAIEDLNALPSPDLEAFGIEQFVAMQGEDRFDAHLTINDLGRTIPVSASRSCPYRCTFCFHPTSQVYRKRDIKRVVAEILDLKARYGARFFAIYDELFDYEKERIDQFCRALIEKKADIRWTCQLRVNGADDADLLRLMRRSGCVWISYGVESGSRTVLESMRKRIRPEQIEKALHATRKADIAIQANFLFGDPAETEETVAESLAFQERNAFHFIDWSAVIPYPGTPLYESCRQQGLITDPIAFTQQISNGATWLWTTPQPPVNMTTMTDEQCQDTYLKLREITDLNHTKRPATLHDFQSVDHQLSTALISCPSCGKQHSYRVQYPAEGRTPELNPWQPFFGVRGINILCPHCQRKMHFSPLFVPHIKALYERFQQRLDAWKLDDEPVVVMPAMDRYLTIFSKRIDLGGLTIRAVLDDRPHRQNGQFFDVSVSLLDDAAVERYRDNRFLLLPSHDPVGMWQRLQRVGIPVDRSLIWSECYQPPETVCHGDG